MPLCTIVGTNGPDLLKGTPGPDVICGRGGADRINGGSGNDLIYGQSGADRLYGGPGRDRLFGGAGHDVLFLGRGTDRFALSAGEDTCVIGVSRYDRPLRVPCASLVGPSRCCSVLRIPPFRESRLPEGSGCQRQCGLPPPDLAPPTVSGAGFWPRSVDLSKGGAAVGLSIRAEDQGNGAPASGLSSAHVTITGPGGRWKELELKCQEGGETHTSLSIPAKATPGAYRITSLTVTDRAGNATTLNGEELTERHDFSEFVAYDGPDTEAPRLTGFALTPEAIDTSAAPATVHFEVEAADGQSGVGSAGVSVSPPGWQHIPGYPDRWSPPSDLDQGTLRQGSWPALMKLPRFAHPGAYEFELQLSDEAGNSRTYDPAELEQLGYPHEFFVSGAGDEVAPTVSDITISPAVVRPGPTGYGLFKIYFHLRDDLSGFAETDWEYPHRSLEEISYELTGPSSSWAGGHAWPEFVSGSARDGIWAIRADVDTPSPAGTYRIQSVYIADRAGNRAVLQGPALEGMGWQTSLQYEP